MTQKFHADRGFLFPVVMQIGERLIGRFVDRRQFSKTSFRAKAKNCAVDHSPTVGCE